MMSKEIFCDFPSECDMMPQVCKANRDIQYRTSRMHAEICAQCISWQHLSRIFWIAFTQTSNFERHKVYQTFSHARHQCSHTLFSLSLNSNRRLSSREVTLTNPVITPVMSSFMPLPPPPLPAGMKRILVG